MIHSLKLRNFRNFSYREISFGEGKNSIIGKNGFGKSNILEALSLPQHSLNVSDPEYLLKQDEDLFSIEYTGDFGSMQIIYDGEKKRKKYIHQKKSISKAKLQAAYPHVVSFHPMGMNLMYLAPSERRNFLDSILLSCFPEYDKILKGYKLVIKNRNKVLKHIGEGKSSRSELEFWNQKFISGAILVYEYRDKICSYFSKHASSLEKYFIGKTGLTEFFYDSKTQGETQEERSEYLKAYIEDNHSKEILLGKTLRGPHLDDFNILINKKSLSIFASRGEVKSILLGLLFLETQFIEEFGQKKEIIFLLDDILSELDEAHRDLIWEHIGKRQSIITSIEDFGSHKNKTYL